MEINRILENLKGIAQTGLAFTKDPFDVERYHQIRKIAEELATHLSNHSKDEVRESWPVEKGYATPKIDVRAFVAQGNKVLLCQERSDGKWTLPGGFADIGLSPSECIVKEVQEETGLQVKVKKLVAIFDRDKHEHPKSMIHIYKMFFLCEEIGGSIRPSIETLGADFFELTNLPELSTLRVTKGQILKCFAHHSDPHLEVEFD